MKATWLGQASFLFETQSGMTIMIDPYMSNHLEDIKGAGFHREVPIDERFIQPPDVLILTHCHDDHTDWVTLDQLFHRKWMTVLAPESVIPLLQDRYGRAAEYVVFTPGTEVTLEGVLFRSIYAQHSDARAIGVVMEAEGKVIYHTGDTMYHTRTVAEAPKGADLLILPINGKGDNMNAADAARLTKALRPKHVLPMHWDMFKQYGCDPATFTCLIAPEDGIGLVMPEHYTAFELP